MGERNGEQKKSKMDLLLEEAKNIRSSNNGKYNLYGADYIFTDRDGKDRHLQFVYREPTEAEMEMYTSQYEKSQNGANNTLMSMMIVAPESRIIMEQVGSHPTPVSAFIKDYLNPLFGEIKEVKPIQRF